jgi:NADPH2:quinone reductase
MQAIYIEKTGGPEVMRLIEADIPIPGPKQVRIKVESVGLNYSDIMIREGKYLERTQVPQILGREFAGVVDALGEGVTHLELGQRVYGAGQGALAEYVVAHARGLMPLPDGMDSDTAVTLVVQGLTALHCLDDHGRLKPGETVLIHAAAGGVGTLAIQIAKQMGAGKIIGTASNADKCALIRELGAEAVNYTEADWAEQVMALTDGKGADLILESVGGDIFTKSYREVLADFGRIVVLGIANRQPVEVSTFEILQRSKSIIGYFLAIYFQKYPQQIAHDVARLLGLMYDGHVKPIIGATFPLKDSVEAFALMEDRKSVGKIVIKP